MNDEARATLPLQVGGTIPERALYIERPEDEEVYVLLKGGTYCNVLTSRQMGKSSLVNHTRQRLVADGIRVISIDLSALGGDQLKDAAAWYRSLMLAVANRMRAAPAFNAWWKERPAEETMGARFQAFVEAFLLRDPAPLVVVFDEVDATRNLGFTDDLFLTIRFLHNARAEQPELDRLTFCLVGVLAADDLIKSTKRTPYNIGQTLRLSDFSRAGCEPLVAYLDGKGLPGARVVDQVLAWTSGQPFLTIALCDKAAREASADVEGFVRAELGNPTTFKVHFDRIQALVKERIVGSSQVRAKYLRMLDGKPMRGVPERDEESLLLAGLVHRNADGGLRLRNRIYRMQFDRRWVEAILPAPPVPRWFWAVLVAFAAAAGAAGVGWKARQREQHEEQVRQARDQILTATTNEQAKTIWRSLTTGGIAPDEVRDAARKFWDRRSDDLRTRAKDLDEAGCLEEAAVVRAFAGARGDDASPPPPPTEAFATLWLPVPLRTAGPVDRCRERRAETCDRVASSAGGLTASCSGKLFFFRPNQKPQTIDGSGSRRLRFGPDGGWSIGTGVNGTLVIAQGGSTVTPKVCPPDPVRITTVAVQTTGNGASIAYVCSDGTYGRQSFPDVRAWFDELTAGKRSLSRGGYGVSTAAWLGGALLTARPGEKGRVEVERAAGISLPQVFSLAAFAENPHLAAFGTEGATPTLGVLGLENEALAVKRTWRLTSCKAAVCLVRAVAGGADEEHVAGLLVGMEGETPSSVSVVLSDLVSRPITIAGDASPADLAVVDWKGQAVVAVPLAGRIRLYSWSPEAAGGGWEAAQRRFGLTVHHGEKVRVERFDEIGHQKIERFKDVFPE